MTITDGWIDWATGVPGPGAKVYAAVNRGLGIVCHSMEGWYEGSVGELMNANRQASWMFSLRTSGELVQHYAVTECPWTSGNFKANTELWSVELEGIVGTPANAAQVVTLQRLGAEYTKATRRPVQRVMPRTVWEHNEVALWMTPNAGPTACPSHRYDPWFAALAAPADLQEEAEAMTADEKKEWDAMKRRIAQLETQAWGDSGIPRDDKHPYADANMYDVERLKSAAATGMVSHTHETSGPRITLSGGKQ